MASNDLKDSREWHRGLAWSRALLALGCLAVQWWPGKPPHWGLRTLTAAFAVYSLAILLRRDRHRPGAALLSLFLDAIIFLAFSYHAATQHAWLGIAFYLYLLLSALMLHQWWDVWIVAGICFGFFAVTGPDRSATLWPVVPSAGLLVCAVAFYKKRMEQLLAERSQEVEEWRSTAQDTQEAERQRIAADFHDGPLQVFIGLQMRLEVLRRFLERDPQAGLKELLDLQEVTRSQVREIRAFLRGVRPVEVDEDGLSAALRRLVAEFQKDSGITATLQCGDTGALHSDDRSIEVLQIVREALHNVRKHSRASRVAITVCEEGNYLEISIDDNGVGFAFSGSFTLEELEALQLGPATIKRRVRGLDGALVVESRPGRGAGVRIRIPA